MNGLFLSKEELETIFPRLKSNEAVLEHNERQVLVKMEKFLYEHLSIEEMEKQIRGSVKYG